MAIALDRQAFVNAFGRDAIVTIGTTSRNIKAIFDREGSISAIGSVAVVNARPSAVVDKDDVEGIDSTSTLEVKGVVYKVTEYPEDAEGFVTLTLSVD